MGTAGVAAAGRRRGLALARQRRSHGRLDLRLRGGGLPLVLQDLLAELGKDITGNIDGANEAWMAVMPNQL